MVNTNNFFLFCFMKVDKNFTNLNESLTKVLVAILSSNTYFLKYTYT